MLHTVNKGPLFPNTNHCLKAKLFFLKSQGLGIRPSESGDLTNSDHEQLFMCGQLGHDTPEKVTNLLHLSLTIYFGMRVGQEQPDL